MEDNTFNRRDFIKRSVKTAAIGVIGFSAIKSINLESLIKSNDTFKTAKVINLSDYPDLQSTGGYAMITKNVIVIRTGSSKFIALNNKCTHKGCETDYSSGGFECPCHGSTFSKTGKVLTGPAKKNLKSYSVSYDADAGTLTINM